MPPSGSTVAAATSVPISTAVSTPMPANPSLAATTDYGTAYNEEGAQYQPEIDQETQALAQLAQQQQTSQASLDQAKANAFKTDSLNANAKGLLYSGYTPATNNAYTTNTYNPAVQNLNTQTANSAQTLQEKIASINNERASAAETLVSDTQTAQAEAAKAAASAASKASSAAAKQPTQQQVVQAIQQGLSAVKGGDGYVSPQDYASAYEDWVTAGYSPASFNSQFKSFQNPNNGYYTYAEQQAQKAA